MTTTQHIGRFATLYRAFRGASGALLVTTRVDLVPWGTLQRSEYKSKLVEHETTRG